RRADGGGVLRAVRGRVPGVRADHRRARADGPHRQTTVARPQMEEAIRRLRHRGLRVAALTNNWHDAGGTVGARLRREFDVFVESAAVGLRKPDPRIYDIVCRELGVAPARAVFLDDIGRNLKPARALGMATIKVDDPGQALRELGALVGLDLVG